LDSNSHGKSQKGTGKEKGGGFELEFRGGGGGGGGGGKAPQTRGERGSARGLANQIRQKKKCREKIAVSQKGGLHKRGQRGEKKGGHQRQSSQSGSPRDKKDGRGLVGGGGVVKYPRGPNIRKKRKTVEKKDRNPRRGT